MTDSTTVVSNDDSSFALAANDDLSQAIKELESPLTITLNLAGNEKVRLGRLCRDASQTEAEFIESLIREQLATRVGAPCIKAASQFSEKISGPKGLVTRG